ncbi:MAG TPA: extracellular solute-binding protein, partial [Roseiflexaceae bacterium]
MLTRMLAHQRSRSLLTTLVLALALALISSCGSSAPAGSSGGGGAATSVPAAGGGGATSAPAAGGGAAEKKSISIWHIQSTGDGPQLIQQAVDRFKADNPNVDVEVVPLQNDPYKTKIKVAMGAGNPPCIFPTWGGGPLNEYVKANQVIDLTPYMTKDNYKSRFVDAAFTPITFDGKIWGVPVENSSLAVIFYNKAIFQKYNLTPPKTYDDLMKVVQTLKDNGVAPFALPNKTKWPGS